MGFCDTFLSFFSKKVSHSAFSLVFLMVSGLSPDGVGIYIKKEVAHTLRDLS